MPRTGPWSKIFIALLFAVLPPILLLVGTLLLTESVLADASPDLVAILVVVGAMAWAAILAIVYTPILGDEFGSMLALAERGERRQVDESGSAYRQLADSLEERNRQVATLARALASVPIDDDPRVVIASLASTARSVMGDATWRFAVLTSPNADLLPPGVHHGSEDERAADPIGDLERWASVSVADVPVTRADGPWGAFTVAAVSASEELRAILYAPWEGRRDPTPAEMDLLALVTQHAGIALDHALLYARVRSQADELVRLAAVQSDFLRGVTHDLQTPLTSIGALAIELQADPQVPAAARKDLESIGHQADRLRRMVSQLLIASRLEASAFTPQQEVFAVPPLVERVWSALRADRPFKFSVEGTPHLAVADPYRLEQVLWALLDNAVKYSPPGSPIHCHLRPDADRLWLTVRDQGTGMDEVTSQRAFEQFYRAPGARKLAPDGSGVGLYAARGLMEAMGGRIDVESRLGHGTSMTLVIPAEPSGAASD